MQDSRLIHQPHKLPNFLDAPAARLSVRGVMHSAPQLPMYSWLYAISASQMLTCGGCGMWAIQLRMQKGLRQQDFAP
jgi:hypothetical protein